MAVNGILILYEITSQTTRILLKLLSSLTEITVYELTRLKLTRRIGSLWVLIVKRQIEVIFFIHDMN